VGADLSPRNLLTPPDLLAIAPVIVGSSTKPMSRSPDAGPDWLAATMGRGEIVGEMALVTGEPRAATVRSVDETVIYEISRQQYEPLLRTHPEWLDELRAVMDDRLARRPASLLQRIRRALSG
jgi:CRP-like cAMP-binding protein